MISHSEAEADSEGTWAVSYGDMVTLLLTFFIVFFSINPINEDSAPNSSLRLALVKALKASPIEGFAHDQQNHIIVEFPAMSFFPSGQIEVTKEGRKALQEFVATYMPYAGNFKIGIRAFTDSRKVDASRNRRFKDNLELSALRAIATMRVLQKAGIPLERLQVGGYGELNMTAQELAALKPEQRSPAASLDFARKVVLVIQPEVL